MCIEDEMGKKYSNKEELEEVWKQYIEKLYSDNNMLSNNAGRNTENSARDYRRTIVCNKKTQREGKL